MLRFNLEMPATPDKGAPKGDSKPIIKRGPIVTTPGKVSQDEVRAFLANQARAEQREKVLANAEYLDISNSKEGIEKWTESIGNLLWKNYYLNLSANQRKQGYVFHCPNDGEWLELEERIKEAEHFYVMLDKSEGEPQLVGFVEMKPLAKGFISRLKHVKENIDQVLDNSLNPLKITHLQLIVIDEKYRGLGLGKQLHHHAKKKALEDGYDVLLLEVPVVPSRNIRSLEFHETGLGMRQIAHTFEQEAYDPDAQHVFEIFIASLNKETRSKISAVLTPKAKTPRVPKKRPPKY